VQDAKNGIVVIPIYDRGHPDYSYEPDRIHVSDRSDLKDHHIDRIDCFRRQQAERFIREEVGIPWSQLRCDDKMGRMRVNATVVRETAAAINKKLFCVSNLDHDQHQALSQSRVWTRLLSFADLQGRRDRDAVLAKYCGDHRPEEV
jgi:hypothetical protein